MGKTDAEIRRILETVRTIAIVGLSPNPVRPSFYVARYLQLKGYAIRPVNPGHAGREILGEPVWGTLAEVPGPVDMVDIFRRSEAVPGIVEEALATFPALRVVWMQLGVTSEAGAQMAEARGVEVVQNRCPKIEFQRLFGELRMGGFNTGVISSRL